VPNTQETIAAIEVNLARMHRYPDWTIGVTSDPHHLETDLEYPAFFRYWEVYTAEQARKVRDHFVERGMQCGNDSGRGPANVYIY